MPISDNFDESHLEALLKQAESGLSVAELQEFALGVAGAPAGHAPTAWVELAVPGADQAVTSALTQYVATIREAGNGLGESPAPPSRLKALRSELMARGPGRLHHPPGGRAPG